MSERLRILPILIVVAMLAFSVRVVEVFVGVRNLSGAAIAAADNNTAETKSDATQSDENQSMVVAQNEMGDDQDSMASESPGELEPPPMDADKWRDASDSNFDTTGVRMEMFKDLSARREELEKRERIIVTREALLKAAEQELERKYQEMSALRTEIESLLEKQSVEEQARIQSLVKIYEGMKPKEAARIFDTLDLDVLVNVMSLMSERRLSPILASMNPERARTVTIMLAEDKKLPELPEN
ncbi:MAG: MotE family protein [Alphaproteobacteria bacterium]